MDNDSFPGSDSTRTNAGREQFRDDLAALVASPEGFRVMVKLLSGMGLGGLVSNDPASIALHNEGETLLRELAMANPGAALRVIAAIRGIEL